MWLCRKLDHSGQHHAVVIASDFMTFLCARLHAATRCMHDHAGASSFQWRVSAQWKPGYHGPACQGPQHSSKDFAKDQALQAWRASRGTSPREGILDATFDSAKDQAKRLGEASGLTGFLPHEASSVSATERTWGLRPPQSHGRAYVR